jgi:hypothetical protein
MNDGHHSVLKSILAIPGLKSQKHSLFNNTWPRESSIYKEVWIIGGNGALN